MSLPLSGSQTVGPYFAIGLASLECEEVPCTDRGERITIEGRLLDGGGQPVPDGFIEIWQADAAGHFPSAPPASSAADAFGFARVPTNDQGEFRFTTFKPGAVGYDATRMQAPHLLVLVYMRGLLRNLVTRLYFPDEPANEADPVLQLVPAERRSTLIAQASPDAHMLRWDIILRGDAPGAPPETVFFSW